jgi:hypothetical protein
MSVQFNDVSSQGVMEWSCRPSGEGPSPQLVPQSKTAGLVWECRIGDLLVGRVGLRHDRPGVVRICFFRLDPQWQHTAVATKLVRRVCNHCAAYGCSDVTWNPGAAPRWLRGLVARQRSRSSLRQAAHDRSASRFACNA